MIYLDKIIIFSLSFFVYLSYYYVNSTDSVLNFDAHFTQTCNHKFSVRDLIPEWNHTKICKWLSYSKFVSLKDDDFYILPPKQFRKVYK
jgi:meiotically up-regulated gene 157 (Mug157) protein